MLAVVQRVKKSKVTVKDKKTGEIDNGLLVFLGVDKKDQKDDAIYLADKIVHLRIFEDDNGKMNRSLLETGGKMLVVSQFTLLGDCSRGRRPSFINAAAPDLAEKLYNFFVKKVHQKGILVEVGQFRAMMDVFLINHGPVTLIVKSK